VQAHLAEIDTGTPTLGVVDIDVTAIDAELASGRGAPDVVKIDVEGAEVQVLEGMRETLERHRPALICEVHGTAPEVCDFLESRGYQLNALEAVESIRYHDGPLHLCASKGAR
jgi:hypothetical protein